MTTPFMPPAEESMVRTPASESQPAVSWHWCPQCKLASSKTGNCAGCGNPLVTAPPEGIPAVPHRPVVPSMGRGPLLGVIGFVVVLAIVGGIVWALASRGQDLTGSSAGTTPSDTTDIGIPTMHETLSLPGRWGIDNTDAGQLKATWEQLVTPVPVEVELGASQGNTIVAVVNIAAQDSETFVAKQAASKGQKGQNSSGNEVTVSNGRSLTIGGMHAAVVTTRLQSVSGDALFTRNEYFIASGSTVTIIEVENSEPTVNAEGAALDQVETALKAMQPGPLGG